MGTGTTRGSFLKRGMGAEGPEMGGGLHGQRENRTDEKGNNVDQLCRSCCEHRDSLVARRKYNVRSGKFDEADCAIKKTDGFAMAFAQAVPSAGNTLLSERHLVGSTSAGFSSNVPSNAPQGSLPWPLLLQQP